MIGLGGGAVRLLTELLDAAHTLGEAIPETDVAVPRLRSGRIDAKCEEIALVGEIGREGNGLGEGILVSDHVIRRHHEQDRVGTVGRQVERCRGSCRGRVSADRFEDQRRVVTTELRQLPLDAQPLALVAHHERGSRSRQRLGALDGHHEHRALVDERQKLLRGTAAGSRPQAAAGTAGQDHGDNGTVGHWMQCIDSDQSRQHWSLSPAN